MSHIKPNNLHLGIDGNEANFDQRVGSNVYAFHILQSLIALNHPRTTIYLKSKPVRDLPRPQKNWQYRIITPGKLWTQWRLPLDLFVHRPQPSLFYSPSHYAPRFSPIPTVITIFDLGFLRFPETFKPMVLKQLKNWTHYSVKKAKHIFTISEFSKQEIIKEYQVNPELVTVAYPGSNLSHSHHKPSIDLPEKFFCFVGTNQPRKNLDRLIKAFIKFSALDSGYKLLIIGKTWHQFAVQKKLSHSSIIYTGYLADKELVHVIQNAKSLILPSLYEGFGIPVLEALKLGTLAACSNTSSLPEIVGSNWPLVFDPKSVQSITKTLKTISSLSPQKQKSLVKQGKIRAKNFSWQKSATTILQKIQELS